MHCIQWVLRGVCGVCAGCVRGLCGVCAGCVRGARLESILVSMAASEKELTPRYGCPFCSCTPVSEFKNFKRAEKHDADCEALLAGFPGGWAMYCFEYDGDERTEQRVTDKLRKPDRNNDRGNVEARRPPPSLFGHGRVAACFPPVNLLCRLGCSGLGSTTRQRRQKRRGSQLKPRLRMRAHLLHRRPMNCLMT